MINKQMAYLRTKKDLAIWRFRLWRNKIKIVYIWKRGSWFVIDRNLDTYYEIMIEDAYWCDYVWRYGI